MALKPELIRANRLTPKAAARKRRTAKSAMTRIMRREARRDPEGAPSRIGRGWID